MEDEVDARLGREAGGFGIAAVSDGRGVERVGGVGNRLQLVERPHRDLAVRVGQSTFALRLFEAALIGIVPVGSA